MTKNELKKLLLNPSFEGQANEEVRESRDQSISFLMEKGPMVDILHLLAEEIGELSLRAKIANGDFDDLLESSGCGCPKGMVNCGL